MLTTELLKQMLGEQQSQDEIQVNLKISCSRALMQAILQGKCPAIAVKLEESEQ